jgi:hypothetical protein
MDASVIIDGAAQVLNDLGGVTYTEDQVIAWINDARRSVVLVRPDASEKSAKIDLVAGTKQSLPADGLRTLAVYRNLVKADSSPGRAVRLVERAALDEHTPDWHSATPATVIREYYLDDRSPKVFWVNPPSDANSALDVGYSFLPADIAIPANDLELDDVFAPALIEWVLYRCFARDSEKTPNYIRAERHFSNFFNLLGIKLQADMRVSAKSREHLK